MAGCSIVPDQGTVIQFATWGSAEEIAVLNQLAAQFQTAHPNIRVDVMHIPENYDQKIHMLAASGLLPDVLAINSWTYPKYACYGLLTNLKPYLESTRDLSPDEFYPTALQAFGDGSPSLESIGAVPRDVSDVVMFINTSLLKQWGIAQPSRQWTWESWMTLARQATQDTNGDGQTDVFGTSFYRHPPLFWLPWVWMAGGQLWDDQGQLALDTPPAVGGIQFAQGLLATGVAPSRQQTGQTTMTQLFLQQKLATMINGRWVVPLLRQQAGFTWDVWPLPAGPKGSITGVDATGYAMSSRTKHPQAAWAWISFLSSQSALEQLVQSGLIVPARRDVAESEVFLSPHLPPTHSRVFLDVLATGQPTQSHPQLEYFSNALKTGLEPIWDRPTLWPLAELTQQLHQWVNNTEKGRKKQTSYPTLPKEAARCPKP